MKHYKLCTIRGFAEYVADIIVTQEKCEIANTSLPDYDFAIADEFGEGKSLKEIALSSSGWYGMKKFDAGFDSIDLCLITDYYGGGSAEIVQIYDGDDREMVVKDIENMIERSINSREGADENTVLIIEFEEEDRTMTREELVESLKAKIEAEWNAYMESLYRMDVDSIITMSYETILKEQICCILENDAEDALEDCQVEKMLHIDNLLDFMYREWLNFDGNEYDILNECIFSERTMERVNGYE